jgi:hypothetical protein
MMFALSLAILLSMLIPEQAAATIIIERVLPNDPVRAPFGIDAARNASFVVFALKHAGRIGWLGTGQCLLNTVYNYTYREFPLPGLDGTTAEPRDVALGNQTLRLGGPGREGFVFFTEFVRNKIGRLDIGDRDTPGYSIGRIDEFSVPTPSSGPMNLAIDPYNGSVWFTEYQANKIGRLFFIPVAFGGPDWRFIEYSLPTANSYPTDIAVDPNYWHTPTTPWGTVDLQTYVWFTMSGSNKIGRLNGETGEIVEYSTRGTPWGITVTEESFVWFTQKLGDRIAKLNPWTAVITEVPVPVHSPGSEPFYIRNDTDGSLWFTESAENRIGKYIPGQNLFQEFVVPTTASKPHGLVLTRRLHPSNGEVGPGIHPDFIGKMDVFFTEEVGNKIGKIIIPSGPWTTTTTVGFVSSASTTTSSATTVTTTATTVSTNSTAFRSIVDVTGTSITVGNFTTTLVDTVSILQTSTTSTWTKTTTSTTVSTMTSTSTSTSTTTSTSPTTSTASTTSTSTESYTTTTTTTTSTTFTSTSYSPTVTTTTTVGMLSTYMTTTTTTTTYTAAQTSQVYLTTTTATTVIVTTTPTPSRACVIASAAYGSELAPQVQFLREFRDGTVMSTFAGTQFMRVFNAFYYSFSPKVAELTAASPILQTGVRAAIYPLISALRFVASVHQIYPGSQLMIVVAGVVASGLIGALYLTPVAILMGMMRKRVRISGGV